MRLALLNQGARETGDLAPIEVIWRDPSTPTISQKADAITKLVTTTDSAGRSIIPVEQAREDLGYGAGAQSRMADWDLSARQDPQLEAAMRSLENAPGSGG